MRPVPKDGYYGADNSRKLGTAYAHRGTREHGERKTILNAGPAAQVHEELDNEPRQKDGGEDKPPVDAGCDEKTRRQRVAGQALDIVGPHVENGEPAPRAAGSRQRRKVLIVEGWVRRVHGQVGVLKIVFANRHGGLGSCEGCLKLLGRNTCSECRGPDNLGRIADAGRLPLPRRDTPAGQRL